MCWRKTPVQPKPISSLQSVKNFFEIERWPNSTRVLQKCKDWLMLLVLQILLINMCSSACSPTLWSSFDTVSWAYQTMYSTPTYTTLDEVLTAGDFQQLPSVHPTLQTASWVLDKGKEANPGRTHFLVFTVNSAVLTTPILKGSSLLRGHHGLRGPSKNGQLQ